MYKKIRAKFDPDVVLIFFFLRDGTFLKVGKALFKPLLDEITITNHRSLFYEYSFTCRFLKDLLHRSKISIRYTDNLTNAYLGDNKQTQAWYLKEI